MSAVMNKVQGTTSKLAPSGALGSAFETLARSQPLRCVGRVCAVRGLTVLVDDLPTPVGALVRIPARMGSGDHAEGSTWGGVYARADDCDAAWSGGGRVRG